MGKKKKKIKPVNAFSFMCSHKVNYKEKVQSQMILNFYYHSYTDKIPEQYGKV